MIVKDDYKVLPCSMECCEEEWETYVKVQKARIPPVPPEHVLDIEEPIKVFLFDVPKTTYSKNVWGAGIYTAANFVIGCLCVVFFMYAYVSGPFCGDMYSKLTKKLHAPLQSVAVILHGSLGMLVFSKFYDSSHMIKWKDRRVQHEKQMSYSIMLIVIDIVLFFTCNDTSDTEVDMTKPGAVCPCDENLGENEQCLCPSCKIDYVSFHFFMGVAALLCYAAATATGIFLFMFLGRGVKGSRGQESLISDIHTGSGLAAYLFALVTLCGAFLYDDFNTWMRQNYGPHLEIMVAVLGIFLFCVVLLSPGLRALDRFKQFRLTARLKREAEEKMRMDEIEKLRAQMNARSLEITKERRRKRKEEEEASKKEKGKEGTIKKEGTSTKKKVKKGTSKKKKEKKETGKKTTEKKGTSKKKTEKKKVKKGKIK